MTYQNKQVEYLYAELAEIRRLFSKISTIKSYDEMNSKRYKKYANIVFTRYKKLDTWYKSYTLQYCKQIHDIIYGNKFQK